MKIKIFQSASVVALLCHFSVSGVVAQEESSAKINALEEIVVTATKRAENLMDVPISVSAISGDKIANQGIQNLGDASAYVPGFSVQPNPIADNINIRGVQSGNQAGFEQSVSTFVDGVYRGRGLQSRFSFLDVGLLEVLRGPQGTLFGKNTVGGALNISTAKPTRELDASISAKYNLEFEETEISGHLSGPLSENLRGRVAFVSREMDKGWVENLAYNENNPVTDEIAVRATLEYDVNENTSLTVKLEDGSFDNTGSPWDLLTSPLEAFGVPGSNDGVTNMGNGPAFFEGIFGPGSAGDTTPVDFGSVAKLDGSVSELSFTLNHELANGADITAIAAYSEYDFQRSLDADFNPFPILRFDDTEDFEQSSIELRYASPQDKRASFIAGLYWQDNNLYVDGLTSFNTLAVDNFTSTVCALSGGALVESADPNVQIGGTLLTNLANGVDVATARTCVNAAVTRLLSNSGLGGFNRYAFLDQSDTVNAVFGELKYDLSDAVTAKIGLRYTEEDKSAAQGVYAANYEAGGRVRNDSLIYALALDLVGEAEAHTFDLDRSESSLTWSANVAWDISDDAMLYASASTGFKAGGYNSFAFRNNPSEAEVEEEDALAFELGAKLTLADGAAELNLAVFQSEFDNLQTALFAGSTSFIVQNAAKATSKGVEIDGRWQLTENLMLLGSAAYTDFSFDSFPNAGCTLDQLLSLRNSVWNSGAPDAFTGALITLQDCGQLGINDLRGQTSENTPEFSASLGLNHVAMINNFQIISNLDLNYQGEQYRAADLDPFSLDESSLRVNASLTLGRIDGAWDFSVIGNNITDENNINYLNDSPLFDGSRQIATMPPRSISVRLRYRY